MNDIYSKDIPYKLKFKMLQKALQATFLLVDSIAF